MLSAIAFVLVGFLLLMWGADRFVDGAAATARNLGVSPMIIGLTVVGFGTSAPEMLVSAVASWQGNTGLAIGNALGSNITNIALILGTSALVTPLTMRSETLKREFPILFATMLITLAMLMDGELNRLDGAALLVGLAVMLYWVTSLGLRSRSDPLSREYEAELPPTRSTAAAVGWLIAGFVVLLISSRLLVHGAVTIAQLAGVSDLVIGLTVVAIGTSIPELAASVMSVLKKEHDIAIGNVMGSNMFNLLAVLGLPGVIHPGAVPPAVLSRDYPVMIGLTLLLFAMAYGFRAPGRISRVEGGLLVLTFVGYQTLLYYTAGA